MERLNFYTVDISYVDYLKDAECKHRGFSRVPNMEYGDKRKPKFLCGVVLQVGGQDYYVPVTSYTQQKPDNFCSKVGSCQETLQMSEEENASLQRILKQRGNRKAFTEALCKHLASFAEGVVASVVATYISK